MKLFNTFSMLIMITMVSMVTTNKNIKDAKIEGETGVDIVLVVGRIIGQQYVNGMPVVVDTFKKFFTANFIIGPNMKVGIVQMEKGPTDNVQEKIVLQLTDDSNAFNTVSYTPNVLVPGSQQAKTVDLYGQSLTNALKAINQMFDAKESTRARVVVLSVIQDYINEATVPSVVQELCSKKNAHIYAMAVDRGETGSVPYHAWGKAESALCTRSTGKEAKPKTENLFLTTNDDAGYTKTLYQIKEKMVHDLCNFKELCIFAKPEKECKYELLQESAKSIKSCALLKPTPKICSNDKCRETCDYHWPWNLPEGTLRKSLPNCTNITESTCKALGNHGVFQRGSDKPESADTKVNDFMWKGCGTIFQCPKCKKVQEEEERKKEEEKRKKQADKQANELMVGLVIGLSCVVVLILIVVVVVGVRMVRKRRMEVAETNAKMEQLMNTITQMSIMTSQMGGPKSIKSMDGKKSMKPTGPMTKSVKSMGGGPVAPKK